MEYKTNTLLKYLFVAIMLVFTINTGMIMASREAVKQKEETDLEAKRPADISIAAIKDSSCTDCADISPIINAIKKTNSRVVKEETFEPASEEAKKIINEFGIKKLPTFVVKGEINKNEDVKKLLSRIGEAKNDAFVLNYPVAPYLDLTSNSVKGKVTVTFISDKSCKDCYDINGFKQVLANNLGMLNPAAVSLDKNDKAAQNLIYKYKIKSVPAFIITGEISEYPNLAGIWLEIGTREKDGAYVLRDIKKVNPNLVYRDLTTGKIIKQPEVKK